MCLCTQLLYSYLTLCESDPMDYSPVGSSVMEYSNTGVCCHALLQGIFLIQGWNLCLLNFLLAGGLFITKAIWEASQSDYKNELKWTRWWFPK